MDAIITGESERIGLSVLDNNDVEHLIEMDRSGEIKAHKQDGYPDDPTKRSPAGIEHVSQARRYARYYVYRERGYDTLPAGRNPDRIEATRQALDKLSVERFEQLFGDYHQQFASHYSDSEPVIEPPVDLGFDISGGADDIKSLGLSALAQLLGQRDGENLYYRQTISLDGEVDTPIQSLVEGNDSFEIDSVGELHALYEQGGEEFETDHNEPRDTMFDARLELAPVPPESLAEFQSYLIYHLACQIRDCYLTAGISPPEQYRTTGPGLVDALRRYVGFDVYEPYHDSTAEINTWQDEFTPREIA